MSEATKMMNSNTNWGVVVTDVCILFISVFVSVWQKNTSYLWLIALMFLTGPTSVHE